jgi:hypothetical protein
LSPGPSDYKTSRPWNGPKYHFAKKYSLRSETSPGPSDYKYNPASFLKANPQATIGQARKRSCVSPREKSPGPQDYEPKKLRFKQRPNTFIFHREKRLGIVSGKNETPGPGSYMIPCKFYHQPDYKIKGQKAFKFV